MVFLFALCLSPLQLRQVQAQDIPLDSDADDQVEADPSILLEEFELEERNIVMAAAKTKTTIQEAPSIITVITASEIRERGHRTLNEVLQTIPGFSGDMWDYNGMFRESYARGIIRGLLVLYNGINVTNSIWNFQNLDHRIPLDSVKRIEVTSGPGGVLWGSNALLGVVNIITKDGADLEGTEFTASVGHGPGLPAAVKGSASFGMSFFKDKKLKTFVNVSYLSFGSQEFTVTEQKLLGVLPAPSNEGLTLILPQSSTASQFDRSWVFDFNGRVGYGPLEFFWRTPFSLDQRPLASGTSVMSNTYYDNNLGSALALGRRDDPNGLLATADDVFQIYALRYRDRFAQDDFGISSTVYVTKFDIDNDPFTAFAASTITPLGVKQQIESENVYRYGFTIDMDLLLPYDNHLIFGGEFFQDIMHGIVQPQWHTTADKHDVQDNMSCFPYVYAPEYDSLRPCRLKEFFGFNTTSTIGAVFVANEWKTTPETAISVGARSQFSDIYSATLLLSSAFVWNIWEELFMKINYTQGFRPPPFISTHMNPAMVNGVTQVSSRDLEVERSQAIETELITTLLRNRGPIRALSLRGDYSYTLLNDLVISDAGTFKNQGNRFIHSIEFSGRLNFVGNHELWLTYYFVDVLDNENGPVRNIPNHTLSTGFKINLYKKYLELNSLVTIRGAMEDANRFGATGEIDPTYFPTNTVHRSLASHVSVDKINAVALGRAGMRVKNLWDMLELNVYFYNMFDRTYYDPDITFDAQVFNIPQPKPRWSFMFNTILKI